MKCAKCGSELNENATFCGNCGEKVVKSTESGDNVETVQEPVSSETSPKFCGNCGNVVTGDSPFCGSCGAPLNGPVMIQQTTVDFDKITAGIKSLFGQIWTFIKKYKVAVIIILLLLAIGLGGYFGYQHFHDFTKLSWDEEYGDYEVTYTTVSEIRLKVKALDKENQEIKEITYTVDKGEVTAKEEEAIWTLPEEAGTYTITAEAPSGKKITKEVHVVDLDGLEKENHLVTVAELEDDQDEDDDGLTNKEEAEKKTNPYLADTDGDGLLDRYELENKLDPLKKDTDGDGLPDGSEIALKTDPLKEDTNGDGVKDGDSSYTTSVTKEKAKMTVTGVGDVYHSDLDIYDNQTIHTTEGLLGKIYVISSSSKVSELKVTLPYTDDDIKEASLVEDNLTIYRFDTENKTLTPIETTVDKEKKTVTFASKEVGRFVLGDKQEVDLSAETHILFNIDDSVSMYTEAQMIEMGYTTSTGAVGNDKDFKRVSLSQQLLDMLSGNYQYAVAEFSGSYYSYQGFTKDKELIKTALNKIHDMEHNTDGTAIVNALNKGIDSFANAKNNNYMILLTDGVNTSGSLSSSSSSIISKAKEKNVKVCVIGLGDVEKDDLTKIAEETGCGFYYASSASVLDEVYAQLSADINYGLVDVDKDGKVDGTIIYDSGFLPSRDGFNFANFSSLNSKEGNCYGMAVVANYFYRGVLPTQLSAFTATKLFGILGSYTSKGYSFGYSSYFRDFNNDLYDYQLSDLKVLFNYEEIPDYFDKVEDGTLKIKEKYRKQITSLGASIETANYTKGDTDYTKIEQPIIDVDSTSLDSYSDDVNLFRAIWRNFIEQFNNTSISFSTDPDKAFKYAVTSMEAENPIVLGFTLEDKDGKTIGGHAVNLIRIIVDNEDSNKFYFEVYDNNRPGTSKYFMVMRNKMNKLQLDYTAWVNDYEYSFEYPEYGYQVDSVTLDKLDY